LGIRKPAHRKQPSLWIDRAASCKRSTPQKGCKAGKTFDRKFKERAAVFRSWFCLRNFEFKCDFLKKSAPESFFVCNEVKIRRPERIGQELFEKYARRVGPLFQRIDSALADFFRSTKSYKWCRYRKIQSGRQEAAREILRLFGSL